MYIYVYIYIHVHVFLEVPTVTGPRVSEAAPPSSEFRSPEEAEAETSGGGRGPPASQGFFYLTVDSKKLEHGCRLIYAGFPSIFGLGLGNCHVPTFWLLL